MDPDNERRLFNMMVLLLSSNGEVAKTQYFLYKFYFFYCKLH